jgi:phage tail sheath protein FI
VVPEVTSDQLTERRAAAGAPAMTGLALHERVSIFGNTPAGLLLLSDVTTSLDESYRPASVNRLVSLVVRAARIVGEESVFEPSGERLWVELRERLSTLLLQLYRAGALRGANAAEAFSVRCDRSTTSQNDLDAGRVIAEIGIAPTAPIETIRVVLAMDDSGQVALVGDAARQDAA